jgi:Yip1 domain
MDFNKIIARAKALILTPRTEWPVIAAEPATVGGIYSGYVLLLAALPAIAQFLKFSVLGVNVMFLGTMRTSTSIGLSNAISYYVLSLISVFVLALIIDALAPTFNGTKDRVQAVKTSAYAYTAGWVGGIGVIIPGLGWLLALAGGIYSIYLLYLGLPHTMKAPAEKATGYTVVIVIAGIVMGLIVSTVSSNIVGRASLGAGLGALGSTGVLGSNATDSSGSGLAQLAARVEQAGKQMDAAQKSGDSAAQAQAAGNVLGAVLGGGSQVEALSTDRIKSFLPATIAGLKQTSSSAERNGALGMQVSEAKATYGEAGRSVDLEITDMAAAKGLMGLASWANIEEDKQTQTGYEKTFKQGDNMIHEEWDNSAKRGEYGAMLAGRFMVTARGDAGSIDELRAAVGSVDLAGLAALRNEGMKAAQ